MRALANAQAGTGFTSRLLKKPHMLRCASPDSLQRTEEYASAYRSSRASPLNLFEQPACRISNSKKSGFYSNNRNHAKTCADNMKASI